MEELVVLLAFLFLQGFLPVRFVGSTVYFEVVLNIMYLKMALFFFLIFGLMGAVTSSDFMSLSYKPLIGITGARCILAVRFCCCQWWVMLLLKYFRSYCHIIGLLHGSRFWWFWAFGLWLWLPFRGAFEGTGGWHQSAANSQCSLFRNLNILFSSIPGELLNNSS